jgi:hypothetical protein
MYVGSILLFGMGLYLVLIGLSNIKNKSSWEEGHEYTGLHAQLLGGFKFLFGVFLLSRRSITS